METNIEPLGDSAAIVSWRTLNDAEALYVVHSAVEQLRLHRIAGINEVTPAFRSLAVYYDSLSLNWTEVQAWISSKLSAAPASRESNARLFEIPVCYEAEFAPDLGTVAHAHSLSPDDVVHLHSSAEYCVQMIGFSPGFPYLAGLPLSLHTPRKSTPRLRVPVGSVGIGGNQTGIYSQETPGGWNIIGRTRVQLFDPYRDPPCLLQAGDRVRFVAVCRSDFEAARGSL